MFLVGGSVHHNCEVDRVAFDDHRCILNQSIFFNFADSHLLGFGGDRRQFGLLRLLCLLLRLVSLFCLLFSARGYDPHKQNESSNDPGDGPSKGGILLVQFPRPPTNPQKTARDDTANDQKGLLHLRHLLSQYSTSTFAPLDGFSCNTKGRVSPPPVESGRLSATIEEETDSSGQDHATHQGHGGVGGSGLRQLTTLVA